MGFFMYLQNAKGLPPATGGQPLTWGLVEVGGEGGGARVLRGLFQTFQTEAGEADNPIHVGLLGGVGETCQADGPAQGIGDAGDFRVGIGQGAGRLRWRCRRES